MSKEIRNVTPNYEHPKDRSGNYLSLLDDFEYDLAEYGEYIKQHGLRKAVAYHNGGPDPERYMLVNDEDDCYYGVPEADRTWLQVFETVSNGSPDSPPFATEDELIEYLCTEGSLYHNQYPDTHPILTRPQAEAFIKAGSAPSMMISGGQIKIGAQSLSD